MNLYVRYISKHQKKQKHKKKKKKLCLDSRMVKHNPLSHGALY
jgi:hypothetical protein